MRYLFQQTNSGIGSSKARKFVIDFQIFLGFYKLTIKFIGEVEKLASCE
jgi:hypothetical protein